MAGVRGERRLPAVACLVVAPDKQRGALSPCCEAVAVLVELNLRTRRRLAGAFQGQAGANPSVGGAVVAIEVNALGNSVGLLPYDAGVARRIQGDTWSAGGVGVGFDGDRAAPGAARVAIGEDVRP